ncbi:MAG: SDR family oxidoreductase [Chloroflexi bacterium]|nr:SDR family oxidoreductase [Chloroflexota bacterium]
MGLQINLEGHLALVTGATGQLGRVMARTLATAGADVVVHYHQNVAKAESLCAEIEALGRRTMAVTGEVGQKADVFAMRDAVVQKLGNPDILVTNAVSQIHPWQTVLEEEEEDYEDQFRSCVLQNVFFAKAFVPAMIEKGWGRFVGINTECSMQLFKTQSAYGGAKRAMDGVLRVLAKEIGAHQITVNQVAPGWTISDRDREQGSERSERYESTVPLARRGTDQEIANVVAFLASDLASFITGAYIPVSGGNVMPTI